MKITNIKFVKSIIDFEKEIFPLSLDKNKPKFFFLGRSNVGKSSLINSLLGVKQLAYSGAKAGKTRSINIFEVNKKFDCMDFPGYGYAVGGKENRTKLRDMILNYLQDNENSNLKAILIIDAYVGPTVLDEEIYDYITAKKINLLIVMNKVDKANRKELDTTISKVTTRFPFAKYIPYSCKTSKYRDEALKEIFDSI